MLLLIFNMLPVYPLDGGQILQALLWFPLGEIRSLQIASVIGLIGGACLAVLRPHVSGRSGSVSWRSFSSAAPLPAGNMPRRWSRRKKRGGTADPASVFDL